MFEGKYSAEWNKYLIGRNHASTTNLDSRNKEKTSVEKKQTDTQSDFDKKLRKAIDLVFLKK